MLPFRHPLSCFQSATNTGVHWEYMTQDAPRSRFLYVEVPLPTKRARAVRSVARGSLTSNTAEHGLSEPGPSIQKEISTFSAGPSLKGKERAVDHDPEPSLEGRNGSLTQWDQAASEERPSAVLPAATIPGSQAIERLSTAVPSTEPEQARGSAQALSQATGSSSDTPITPGPDMEASSPVKENTKHRKRKRRRKRTIAESEGSSSEKPSSAEQLARDEDGAAGSTNASKLPNGTSASLQQETINTAISEVSEPQYTSLGVDEEISKILGRELYGKRYAYTVKLSGGQRAVVSDSDGPLQQGAMPVLILHAAQVPESALHEYQDLLDDWLNLFEGGWREDGKVYSDSESEGDSPKTMRQNVDSDEAYSDHENEASADEEKLTTEEDVSSDESDEVPLRIEASRRSEREGAKKKIDYSKQAEYNEEDEDMSDGVLTDSESDLSDMDDVPGGSRSNEKSTTRSKKGNKRSEASSSELKVWDDNDDKSSEEEFVEGGFAEDNLRPEQFHRQVRNQQLGFLGAPPDSWILQSCSNCKASSALILLPDYIKKAKRKRKNGDQDGEWDVSSIKEYGR